MPKQIIRQLVAKTTVTLRGFSPTFRNYVAPSEVVNIVEFLLLSIHQLLRGGREGIDITMFVRQNKTPVIHQYNLAALPSSQ